MQAKTKKKLQKKEKKNKKQQERQEGRIYHMESTPKKKHEGQLQAKIRQHKQETKKECLLLKFVKCPVSENAWGKF